MSIKYKIALLFALLASIILSAAGLSIFFFSQQERQSIFSTRLHNRAISTAKIASEVKDGNYSLISILDTASVSSLYNKSIAVFSPQNHLLYQFAATPGNEIKITQGMINDLVINKDHFFHYNGREAVAMHYVSNGGNFIVTVAAEDIDGKTYLQELRELLLWVTLAGISISFFAGLLFARTLITPITKMMAEVNLISSKNLSQRIEKGQANDELYKLSQTFNDLLDRLQESFIIQRRFISNASHELSTPLTAVSSQLEVTLQKDRSSNEYKEVLLSIQEDMRGLQQLTKTLLDIAKTGSEGSIDLADVRIDEILLKVAADVQKLNPVYRINVHFETLPDDESLLTVFGNNNLLYIAFKNIVENGCKYADDHTAFIKTSFDRTNICITVNSKGDVIAESDIENIFQPFFRADTVLQKQGSGLGLTLTKRILSLHKGKIEVASDPLNGTVFTIELQNKITRHGF
ncbi:MAG: HAMP domain-containing sensor histidine kinase [Ferruginibacter sp.]